MQRVSGITGAGPLLHDVAVYLQAHYPSPSFQAPAGLTRASVCTQSGLLAGKKCAHTQEELFLSDHLPDTCTGRHQAEKAAFRILSPTDGDVFKLDPAVPLASQALKLAADCAGPCAWRMDGKKLKGNSCQTWWVLQAGQHALDVTCGGHRAALSFEVLP